MCFYNSHVITNGTGIPVANQTAGLHCDCGEFVLVATGGTPALALQYTPNGQLIGR